VTSGGPAAAAADAGGRSWSCSSWRPAERFSTEVRGGAGAAPDRRAGRAFREASRAIGRPVLSLHTDDCRRDAERLKANGVVFVREPARMEYGGMDAVFDDTSGNLVNLHQD
jgi:predicted enzyme related to lactoylglutathione lyase